MLSWNCLDIVILTPYLGQLQQMRILLAKSDCQAVIGELDAADLARLNLDVAPTPNAGS